MYPWCFMFVCLFIAAWAIFQLSGGCHHYRWLGCKFRPMLGAQGHWAGRDLYRATPTATQNLGLYSLIRKTGTHVPQWGSNPQLKDHQIFEPDALSTAPHGRLDVLCTTTIDVVLATSTSILSIEMGFIEQLHYIITVVIHFTAGQEKIAEMVERLWVNHFWYVCKTANNMDEFMVCNTDLLQRYFNSNSSFTQIFKFRLYL